VAQIGYTLSSEEHAPSELVRHAARAEEAGFGFALISDHFHPWIDRQGHSPFVWSVIGGVSQVTRRLRLGTGVTCPLIRIHPAIIAQAAATAGCMMPGRFFLAVGTGENLNEHILGDRWPPLDQRWEMLQESVEVIRALWEGRPVTHRGSHYTVEDARVYDLPHELPPIIVAAAGSRAAELAGRIGDGLVSVAPDPNVVRTFQEAGGKGKPAYGQLHVCWAEDEGKARRIAHEQWPNTSIEGELSVELPLPRHFEQAAQMVSEEDVAGSVVCGPDPQRHVDAIRQYVEAGFDHVYVHQVGQDQEGFFQFYRREVLPEFGVG